MKWTAFQTFMTQMKIMRAKVSNKGINLDFQKDKKTPLISRNKWKKNADHRKHLTLCSGNKIQKPNQEIKVIFSRRRTNRTLLNSRTELN